MKTLYDIELINKLKSADFFKDIIIYEDTSSIIDSIEKNYIMGFNGINWSVNKFILYVDTKKTLMKQTLFDKFFEIICTNFLYLANEKIIIIGDSLTNVAYEMSFNKFITIHNCFFDIPQHTYIWFPTSKKCINLTFEDELFFG